jgi:quercetin dioxygenase-like cupin family protein
MTDSYPRTIDNGAGEQITWLGIRRGGDGGDYLEVSGIAQPGAGPPRHVHRLQAEQMTVDTGRIGYQVAGGPERFAGPGETVTFPAGQVHRWWNAGDSVATMHGWVSPPGNFEYFLTEVFASTRRSGGRRPSPADAAFLLGRYGSEFAITDIPAAVQHLVFPLVRGAGRACGRYQRFCAAPPPAAG